MSCCVKCIQRGAVALIATFMLVAVVRVWLHSKSYVFSADDIAAITNRALESGKDANLTFAIVEAELRQRYGGHIADVGEAEWLFMNCGGWMGAMYLLHASLTEYVLFFGTAVDTSGHSGRYWANITDTMVSGRYCQWTEGGMTFNEYTRGDTIVHLVGEATALQWDAGTWMVEYGRGFIPSTLLFALADNIFSTTDHYLFYKVIRAYAAGITREVFQGNI